MKLGVPRPEPIIFTESDVVSELEEDGYVLGTFEYNAERQHRFMVTGKSGESTTYARRPEWDGVRRLVSFYARAAETSVSSSLGGPSSVSFDVV